MAEGWIKLNRSLQDHWLWKDEPYDKARAWIDLIMLANWEDKKMPYKDKIVVCKRGDVNLSLLFLANRWHWSRPKVTRFIKILESDGMITTDITRNRTTITIVNYDKFQCQGTTDVTTNDTHDVTTRMQRACITKKEKKDKEVRNKTGNKFNAIESHNYDFEALESLLGN